jgi:ABC-type transport system substrate-binding protein
MVSFKNGWQALAVVVTLIVSNAVQAQPEGELVIALPNLGREIFTPLAGTSPEQIPMGMWNEKLLYRGHGKDHQLYPGLAESWSLAEDGKAITFNLHKNIEFNEGWGPFTAADVKFSLELVMRDDSVNINKHLMRSSIASIDVVNPYVIRFNLNKPAPDLPVWLSDTYAFVMIVSKKYYESVGEKEAAKHPVGTGPFVFKEHVVGDHLTVEAVDKHWRKTSDFKRIVIKIVPEENTRVAMMKAGEADIVLVSTPSLAELEAGGFQIISNPDSVSCSITFGGMVSEGRESYDPSQPWTPVESDKARKVRKALDLAVNKQEILKYVLKDKGSLLAVHEFVPGAEWTNPEWKPSTYDPKAAKALLVEAGYPNGFEKPINMYSFAYASAPEMRDISEAVARYWEAIGLKVNRTRLDDSAWRDLWYPRGPKARWSAAAVCNTQYVEPVTFYINSSMTTTRSHFFLESTKFDELVNSAANTDKPEQRKQLQFVIGQYLHDNNVAIPIATKDILWGTSSKLSGWLLNNGNNNMHNLEYIQRRK